MTEYFFLFAFDSQDYFLYFVCWKSPIIKLSVLVHLCFVTLAPSSEGRVTGTAQWPLTSSKAGPS